VVIINLAFIAAMPVCLRIRPQLPTAWLETWIALTGVKG